MTFSDFARILGELSSNFSEIRELKQNSNIKWRRCKKCTAAVEQLVCVRSV